MQGTPNAAAPVSPAQEATLVPATVTPSAAPMDPAQAAQLQQFEDDILGFAQVQIVRPSLHVHAARFPKRKKQATE